MNPPPKIGDTVETKIGKEWVRVVIECDPYNKDGDRFRVRRERYHTDPLCPAIDRWIEDLRPVTDQPPRDPLSTHVFADWFEDNNFSEAATALRNAFPLTENRGGK